MSTKKSTIVLTGPCVKCRWTDRKYSLPFPSRHSTVVDHYTIYEGIKLEDYDEGFIDVTGKFHTRLEAMAIAIEAQQLTLQQAGQLAIASGNVELGGQLLRMVDNIDPAEELHCCDIW